MIAQQEEVQKAMSAESPSVTAVSQPGDHLNLLVPETGDPWYKSFVANVRERSIRLSFLRSKLRQNPFLLKISGETARTLRTAGLIRECYHGTAIALFIFMGTTESPTDGQGSRLPYRARYRALRAGKAEEKLDGRRRWWG